ncbi:unnamed protein product, partial [Prorocentrum cordatum]
KSFADTLIGMLNNMKCFGPAEATQIIDALRGEPCGEDQTKRMMSIVDSKVAKGSGPAKPEGSANKQLLKEWWSYLTSSDWVVINDPKISLNRKMTTLVERGVAVGCTEPSEQTYKWGLATLLVTHYDAPPEPRKVHSILGDLKVSFKTEKKDFGFDRIMEYPASPSELPPDIVNAAYPGDDQPTKIELKGINAIADKISLRSNRGALVASPNDPIEMGLFYEYQQTLLEYRKGKSQ